jgi:transposase InsO family protein
VLRQPEDSRRAAGARLPDESQARGTPDADPRVGRPAPPAVPGDHPIAASVPHCPQRVGAAIRAGGPNQAWVTDITCIPTGEGWLYLAVILDVCSRFAVG